MPVYGLGNVLEAYTLVRWLPTDACIDGENRTCHKSTLTLTLYEYRTPLPQIHNSIIIG